MSMRVEKFEWTILTGDRWWSGTDDRVYLDIYDDDERVFRGLLEPGNTPRLRAGEHQLYTLSFADLGGEYAIRTGIGDAVLPSNRLFREGIKGHLEVRFETTGTNAWQVLEVDSTVHEARLESVAGTRDLFEVVRESHDFSFYGPTVVSQDPDEGGTVAVLAY